MNRVQTLPPERKVFWPGSVTWAAIASGVMLTTALPPMRHTALLAPVALAMLFHLVRVSPCPGRTAWFFGLAHQATLLYWLFFLDPAKSIPTRALVPIQALAAIAYCALYALLFGVVAGQVRRRLGVAAMLVALPPLWTAVELLRGAGELGFPWCLVGSAWLDTPLMPLYASSGEIGVGAATALTAASCVAVFDLWRRRPAVNQAVRWGLVGAAVVAWGGLTIGAHWRGDEPVPASWRSEPLDVGVVQANVALADKWADAAIDSTRLPYTRLTEAAAAHGAGLVVWAETAVPAYLRYERDLMVWVRDLARENRVPIFAGFPDATRTEEGKILRYNSSGYFSAYGTLLLQYAKHHLLPIGETMPFERYLPFLAHVDVGQAEWTPGNPPGPLPMQTVHGEFPFACLICYEAIFSDLARGAVRRGAGCLVNITNDGWFGRTSGPLQHSDLSRIRAAECDVPVVRCANNGVSYISGPDGRVRAELGLQERGYLLEPVSLHRGDTFYVKAGIWPVVGYLLVWLAFGLVLARREPEVDR